MKSNRPADKEKYCPKKNKNMRKIIKEEMIIRLLIPNIIGIEINTPVNAFLEVVKIIVRVVIAKSKIEIICLKFFVLFK